MQGLLSLIRSALILEKVAGLLFSAIPRPHTHPSSSTSTYILPYIWWINIIKMRDCFVKMVLRVHKAGPASCKLCIMQCRPVSFVHDWMAPWLNLLRVTKNVPGSNHYARSISPATFSCLVKTLSPCLDILTLGILHSSQSLAQSMEVVCLMSRLHGGNNGAINCKETRKQVDAWLLPLSYSVCLSVSRSVTL